MLWTRPLLVVLTLLAAGACSPGSFHPLEGPEPGTPTGEPDARRATSPEVVVAGAIVSERDGRPILREKRPRVRIEGITDWIWVLDDGGYRIDVVASRVSGRTLQVVVVADDYAKERRQIYIPDDVGTEEDRSFTLDFRLRPLR